MVKVNVFMDDTRLAGQVYPGNDCDWVLCRTVGQVITLLEAGIVHDLSLDHDMGEEHRTGYDLLKHMEQHSLWPTGEIIVHSANPVGAKSMRDVVGARNIVRKCKHGRYVTINCEKCDAELANPT